MISTEEAIKFYIQHEKYSKKLRKQVKKLFRWQEVPWEKQLIYMESEKPLKKNLVVAATLNNTFPKGIKIRCVGLSHKGREQYRVFPILTIAGSDNRGKEMSVEIMFDFRANEKKVIPWEWYDCNTPNITFIQDLRVYEGDTWQELVGDVFSCQSFKDHYNKLYKKKLIKHKYNFQGLLLYMVSKDDDMKLLRRIYSP